MVEVVRIRRSSLRSRLQSTEHPSEAPITKPPIKQAINHANMPTCQDAKGPINASIHDWIKQSNYRSNSPSVINETLAVLNQSKQRKNKSRNTQFANQETNQINNEPTSTVIKKLINKSGIKPINQPTDNPVRNQWNSTKQPRTNELLNQRLQPNTKSSHVQSVNQLMSRSADQLMRQSINHIANSLPKRFLCILFVSVTSDISVPPSLAPTCAYTPSANTYWCYHMLPPWQCLPRNLEV